MNILQIVISVFLFLEILNILVLYLKPETKRGNGLGIFKDLEKLKENKEVYQLFKYLTNWIANAKLIFVSLGITIVIFGNEIVQFHAALALVFSTLMFYITLYPILSKMDDNNRLNPKGYSKTLAYTILSFILTLIFGLILYFAVYY